VPRRSFLLFSGANDRAVFALARAMETCGAQYAVVARNDNDRILHSSHRHRVCAIRTSDELSPATFEALMARVREIVPDDTLVIVPSSEYLNTFLLGLDRDDLRSRLGCEIPLVGREMYLDVSNKLSSANRFSKAGIRVPARLNRIHPDDLPIVAKPIQNVGADGVVRYPLLLRTRADLDSFLNRADSGQYFAQEFVVGQSEYLLTYIAASGEVFLGSQSNLAQQPNGKSIVLASTSTFMHEPVAAASIALLRDIGFHGFAMIEFIVDAQGPCFIELNPRPWGPLQLCIDHACGIVEAFIGDVLHGNPLRYETIWKDKPARARYLWLGGMAEVVIDRKGALLWRARSTRSRLAQLVMSICSDVYMRRDSWKVFARELLQK
jgi:predicted ATP-grasp superfamily ATP-dependent carboligase